MKTQQLKLSLIFRSNMMKLLSAFILQHTQVKEKQKQHTEPVVNSWYKLNMYLGSNASKSLEKRINFPDSDYSLVITVLQETRFSSLSLL